MPQKWQHLHSCCYDIIIYFIVIYFFLSYKIILLYRISAVWCLVIIILKVGEISNIKMLQNVCVAWKKKDNTAHLQLGQGGISLASSQLCNWNDKFACQQINTQWSHQLPSHVSDGLYTIFLSHEAYHTFYKHYKNVNMCNISLLEVELVKPWEVGKIISTCLHSQVLPTPWVAHSSPLLYETSLRLHGLFRLAGLVFSRAQVYYIQSRMAPLLSNCCACFHQRYTTFVASWVFPAGEEIELQNILCRQQGNKADSRN